MLKSEVFPGKNWKSVPNSEININSNKLKQAKGWLDKNFEDSKYRVAIVRNGYLVSEWTKNLNPDKKIPIASANKSLLSSALGIAISEGKILSVDDKAVDYFPEMMDVPQGEGPKEGRHAFKKDKDATLRHLICNVSGYMKPGEEPGMVFNYQTNGMCVLSHCIEKAYGLYDNNDPSGSQKIPTIYKNKIADVINANWEYTSGSQKMHKKARLNIFGWGSGILTTARDLARIGWLWCNWGRWEDKQVIPESWVREITLVAPDILANSPENTWKYGHGFWTNEKGKLWPDLPKKGFTSWGSGGHYTVVFPDNKLVVCMNPTPYHGQAKPYETTTLPWIQQQEFLKIVLEACGD